MRRTRRQSFLMSNLIYVITGVLVIIVLVLILGTVLGKDDKPSGSGDSTMLDTENALDIGEVKNSLKEDTVPELTELIQQYYTAMSACDVSTLEQIVSDVSDADKDIIRRKKDYIESYNNITVYSKLAPVDGCYLVFAGYDIKFKNEDTMVPGLETFYVKTSQEDKLYIYKGSDIEPEVETFINEQISSDEVQVLFEDVNDRYVDALASSSTLLLFIEGFGGDTALIEEAKKRAATMTAEATVTPTPDTADVSETPAPEETPATTPATQTPQTPQATTTPAAPTEDASASTTNETVLVIANVNLRSSNDESAERITTMIVGDQATRISITDNGWSKVQYNGTEGYVKTDYVTTFKLTSDSVKPTTTINVRLEASETANMAGQITSDMTITRYAICDNGWSQISYDGGVGYVKTEYLTN